MNDQIRFFSFKYAFKKSCITDITLIEFETREIFKFLNCISFYPGIIEIIEIIDSSYLDAALHHGTGKVRSDKTSDAGDNYFFHNLFIFTIMNNSIARQLQFQSLLIQTEIYAKK